MQQTCSEMLNKFSRQSQIITVIAIIIIAIIAILIITLTV